MRAQNFISSFHCYLFRSADLHCMLFSAETEEPVDGVRGCLVQTVSFGEKNMHYLLWYKDHIKSGTSQFFSTMFSGFKLRRECWAEFQVTIFQLHPHKGIHTVWPFFLTSMWCRASCWPREIDDIFHSRKTSFKPVLLYRVPVRNDLEVGRWQAVDGADVWLFRLRDLATQLGDFLFRYAYYIKPAPLLGELWILYYFHLQCVCLIFISERFYLILISTEVCIKTLCICCTYGCDTTMLWTLVIG